MENVEKTKSGSVIFFDFKLWTVWFYGGLNNGENTITINGKGHILP